MPKDAKLGLVVGMGLVLTIGIVFFRKEPVSAGGPEAPSAIHPAQTSPTEPNPPAPLSEPASN
jgi:hypothetical protein